jgi:hypothetical protein
MNTSARLALGLGVMTAALAFAVAGSRAQVATDVICNGCVGSKDIGRKQVKSKNIAMKTIKPDRLKAPTGAAGTTWSDTPDIGANQIVQNITVEIPYPGVVVVNASGYFRFDSADGEITCSITDGATIAPPYLNTNGSTTAADQRTILAGTRAFEETTSGVKTYNLVCSPGIGDDVDIFDAVVTAIYAPKNISSAP